MMDGDRKVRPYSGQSTGRTFVFSNIMAEVEINHNYMRFRLEERRR